MAVCKQTVNVPSPPFSSCPGNVGGYFMTTKIMTVKQVFILTIFVLTTSCNNVRTNNSSLSIDTLNTTKKQTFEILCDTVYENKNYKIILEYYPNGIEKDSNNNNTIFTFTNVEKSTTIVIFKDTVYSHSGLIEFKDFNNDNLKDVLIQNISDVRSNWTFNLYLVDTINDRIKKIKGFNEIKNPRYLAKFNLVDNFVNSGRNWTSFYKIQGDSIKNFDIFIYEDQTDDGKYQKDYEKAIEKIMNEEKNNR
jgi:hypothetical protein